MATYHILIVDDQHEVRRMLRSGLQTLGMDIQIVDVPSGEEAMLVVSRQSLDLLIADVRLPGFSGLELKQRALLQNPGLKLILITGVTDPVVRRQVAEAGADYFFLKPIEIPEFLKAVRVCLIAPEPGQPGTRETIPQKSLDPELTGWLHNLRQDLGAISIMLVDANGRVLAGEGSLSTDEAAGLSRLPDLLDAYNNVVKIAASLEPKISKNLFFSGGDLYDLYLANVGLGRTLVLVLPGLSNGQTVEEIASRILAERPDLLADLEVESTSPGPKQKGEPGVLPDQPEAVEMSAKDQPVLDEIFRQASEDTFKPEDVDAFWQNLAQADDGSRVVNTDALSYEQARKLGLAPEDPLG